MSSRVVRTSHRRIVLHTPLGRGGEGEVFLVDGGQEVAKIYYPHRCSTELRRKIEVMVARPPKDPMRSKGHISLAWPTELLFELNGTFVGFLMPYLSRRRCRCLHEIYLPADYPDGINFELLARTARNLAAALDALHGEGYVAGDLNESNILVATDTVVTFVDCDSMQVPDPGQRRVYRCTVGKPEYTPPELYGQDFARVDRSLPSDRFALAVLICRLLVLGRHPFSGGPHSQIPQNIATGATFFANGFATAPRATPSPDILPSNLQLLFRQAFVEGGRNPARRPSAGRWVEEIDHLLAHMKTCARLGSHRFGSHMTACPWCAYEKKFGFDPFPKRQHRSSRHRPGMAPPKWGSHGAPAAGASQRPVGGRRPRAAPPILPHLKRKPRAATAPRSVRAMAGAAFALLLLTGLLLNLPWRVPGGAVPLHERAGRQASGRQGSLQEPTEPPSTAPSIIAQRLRLQPSIRSDPALWRQLAVAGRDGGDTRLAVGAGSIADLLSSDISSAVDFRQGLAILAVLRSVRLTDDAWLGRLGDQLAADGKRESAQVLYYLAHYLGADNREWLRRIEPRSGLRVRRGRDWRAEYSDQDGGAAGVGTVTAIPPETPSGWIEVLWDSGSQRNWYRWGDGGSYDLRLTVPWNNPEH